MINLLVPQNGFLKDGKVFPFLAPLYLKSFLESKGVKVVLSEKPVFSEYYGITVSTPNRFEAQEIIKQIRGLEKTQKAKVVVGGPHITSYYPYTDVNADFYVQGDGQYPLEQIVKGGKRTLQKSILSAEEWSQLPRPDRSSSDALEYLNRFKYELDGCKATTMLVATGCCGKCSFCSEADSKVRWSSVERVSDELFDIVNAGFKAVYVFDDLFAISVPSVKKYGVLFAKNGLKYRCNAQANFFTRNGEEMAKTLKNTGCVEIGVGFESGSQRILDLVGKGTTVEQNLQTVQIARKHGLKIKGFILIGLPWEDWYSLQETERFIQDSGLTNFQVAVYYPFKGTKIRKDMETNPISAGLAFKEGLGAYAQNGIADCVVSTPFLTSEQLAEFKTHLENKYKK